MSRIYHSSQHLQIPCCFRLKRKTSVSHFTASEADRKAVWENAEIVQRLLDHVTESRGAQCSGTDSGRDDPSSLRTATLSLTSMIADLCFNCCEEYPIPPLHPVVQPAQLRQQWMIFRREQNSNPFFSTEVDRWRNRPRDGHGQALFQNGQFQPSWQIPCCVQSKK